MLLVGTYTRKTRSVGIYTFEHDADCLRFNQLVANEGIDNPSWLAAHPRFPVVYSVNEYADREGGGGVSAFRVQSSGRLVLDGQVASLGGDPCHLAVDPGGRFLLVSNYSGGSFAVYELAQDGRLGALVSMVQHSGRGVDPMRQKGPHVHSATLSADGAWVYVADLGIDEILGYPISGAGHVDAGHRIASRLKPGAGPRLLCFDNAGRFAHVINELDSTIVTYARESSKLTELRTTSTLQKGYTDANYCAHIELSGDGRFLYASNRGHDSIVVFEVREDAALSTVQHVGSGGVHPRHFCFSPDECFVLVANRDTNNIVVFARDADTGRLTKTGTGISVPAPVCVLFS